MYVKVHGFVCMYYVMYLSVRVMYFDNESGVYVGIYV